MEAEQALEAALTDAFGSRHQVALVGCGKAKLTSGHVQAKDLYIGVPFRMAYAHALNTADDVFVLSAMHGLISPHTYLVPYDMSMVQIPPSKHLRWGQEVLAALHNMYPTERLAVTFYAGQQYVSPIMRAMTDEDCYWTFTNPLEGMGLFERLKWFKDHKPKDEE